MDGLTPTVASRGKGQPPSDKQRAEFAKRLRWGCWTLAEVAKWQTWGATLASKKTMSELIDWFTVERFNRRRATPGAEPDRAGPPTDGSQAA